MLRRNIADVYISLEASMIAQQSAKIASQCSLIISRMRPIAYLEGMSIHGPSYTLVGSEWCVVISKTSDAT